MKKSTQYILTVKLKDVIEQLRPTAVLVSESPDLPVFISSKENFETEFKNFIKHGSSKVRFCIKPDPIKFEEAKLNGEKLYKLVEQNFNQGKYCRANTFIMEKNGQNQSEEINCILNPLLWARNHKENDISVIFADFPYFIWLDLIARTLPYKEFCLLLHSIGNDSESLKKFKRSIEQNYLQVNDIRALFMTELMYLASSQNEKMLFVVG